MTQTQITILSIDDEPLVRESLVAFLEDSGYRMLEAENGEQGLQIIHEKQPDLVICDLHMPVMGGLDVLEQLRKESIDIPFIVVSGAGVIGDAVQALQLGAWDYILKPIVDMATLEHAVFRSLERKQLLVDNENYRFELQESLNILKADQEAGRCMQQQLLPAPKKNIAGYHFSHHVLPSLYLSGDFVDYFKIDDQHLGFYMADVSGHGASSAFVTVLCKTFIDGLVAQYQQKHSEDVVDPEKLFIALNNHLINAKLGKHVTLFYGVIDLENQELRYCSSGLLPPPLLVDEQGAHYLAHKGMPIGLVPNQSWHAEKALFKQGTKLILMSDGILEILPQAGMDDKQNYLSQFFAQNKTIDIKQALQQLIPESTQSIPDDITLLMVSK
ncbi:MAG: SpoIIE family protein phosphatase [Gammaproteobacteria bacterium]|jgi:serine phosphatase RsbU (regulator of sigma subunit)